MQNEKIERLKINLEENKKWNINELKEYISSTFKKAKFDDNKNKIEFSINDRRSGYILYELNKDNTVKNYTIDTDIYSSLSLSDINQH